MAFLIFLSIAVVLILIIRFFIRNSSTDNLMKQFELPLEDRVFLMKKYGPSKINKWVIQQYITEKTARESFSKPENQILQAKAIFVRSFQELTKDFNLANAVTIRFSEKNLNNLEVLYSCERDNINLEAYLETAIFNKDAYKNFESIGLEKIYFIDEKRKEFEVISLNELGDTVNRL